MNAAAAPIWQMSCMRCRLPSCSLRSCLMRWQRHLQSSSGGKRSVQQRNAAPRSASEQRSSWRYGSRRDAIWLPLRPYVQKWSVLCVLSLTGGRSRGGLADFEIVASFSVRGAASCLDSATICATGGKFMVKQLDWPGNYDNCAAGPAISAAVGEI